MNNNIQMMLSSIPSATTVSKNSDLCVGIADRIMSSLYNRTADDMLTQAENINKAIHDNNEFNRIVKNDAGQLAQHKAACEHIVHEAMLNMPYREGDHTFAESNIMIPGTFSKAICEALGASHQINGKNYAFEQSIGDMNVSPEQKTNAVHAGLVAMYDQLSSTAALVGEWGKANGTNAVYLLEFLQQHNRQDLFVTVKELLAQQNLLMTLIRIVGNMSEGIKNAGTNNTASEQKNVRTCGQVNQMINMVQSNNTWISKLSAARDQVISALLPDELEAILTITKLWNEHTLDKYNVVDVLSKIQDKNVLSAVIAGFTLNGNYPLNTVVEVSVVAGALRRANSNVNINDELLTKIANAMNNTANISTKDIIKADVSKGLGFLMRLYGIAVGDADAVAFGMSVVPQVIQYGASWANDLNIRFRHRGVYDVKLQLVENYLKNVKGTALENSKYMEELAVLISAS